MKIRCPNLSHSHSKLIRNGFYDRRSDSKRIRRYICVACKTSFSSSTLRRDYYQKKRRITPLLKRLLASGVSQRRAALILKVDPKTVVRRFRYLATEARLSHENWIKTQKKPLTWIQFDDLETSEHTKCKPLSVALAVEPRSRKILGYSVSSMPAKGLLAKIALKKYGPRTDERKQGWNELLQTIKPLVSESATFTSDENPHYPKHLLDHFPRSSHIRIPGGRGANTGQGELKKKRFDPLFSLNHTCAMLRANLNRLFRNTWCTTKNKQGLLNHLHLYAHFHNQVLTSHTSLGGS